MRRKLSDQEIYRIHQLARSGTTVGDIAEQFSVHRNTIGSHLRLKCAYSDSLLKRVRAPLVWDNNTKTRSPASCSLPPTSGISPAVAAIYLPGWPSTCRVARLRRAGVLQVNKRGHMTEALIRKACKLMMDSGVWFDSRNLVTYFGADASAILNQFADYATHCRYWRSREYFYLPAIPINAAGFDASIPISVLSRVSECLRISGIATL